MVRRKRLHAAILRPYRARRVIHFSILAIEVRVLCPLQPHWEGRKEMEGINWLRVSGTAECAQVDQRVCHHFHAIVPLLDAFKAEQQPFELVFPRKGALDSHA